MKPVLSLTEIITIKESVDCLQWCLNVLLKKIEPIGYFFILAYVWYMVSLSNIKKLERH